MGSDFIIPVHFFFRRLSWISAPTLRAGPGSPRCPVRDPHGETASADVINGSFDYGATGWSTSVDPSTFSPSSFRPLAVILVPTPCFPERRWYCPPVHSPPCAEIPRRDRVHDHLPAPTLRLLLSEPGTARIAVTIDGFESVWLIIPSRTGPPNLRRPLRATYPRIVLVIDPGDNSWGASIDNVHAACAGTVDYQARSWGGVKGMYR